MDASPKYKGVRKRKWGKWVAEIRLPNSRERIWLGSFDSPEKAARAFDAALYCLRGPQARFNFPDNPPDIPNGRSLTPQQIQAVANRYAAEENQPQELPRVDKTDGEEEGIVSARGVMTGGSSSGGGPTLGQVGEDINYTYDSNVNDNTTTYRPFLWEENLVVQTTSDESGFYNDDSTNLYSPLTQQQHEQHQQISSDFYYDETSVVEDDYSHYNINLWNF